MTRLEEMNRLRQKVYDARDALKRRMENYYWGLPSGSPKIKMAHVKTRFQREVDALKAILNSVEAAAESGGDSCDW